MRLIRQRSASGEVLGKCRSRSAALDERLLLTEDVSVAIDLGDRVSVGGGYEAEPTWLRGVDSVVGTAVKWNPGQNDTPALVVHLDQPLTAEGDVRGERVVRTGSYLVLQLRYVGQVWDETGTVHVELCSDLPAEAAWPHREMGAWVESHATYRRLWSDG